MEKQETLTAKEFREKYKKPMVTIKKEKSPLRIDDRWQESDFSFTIKGELPSLNEYINAERTNRYKAANIKKNATNLVAVSILSEKHRIKTDKIHLKISYFCSNKRKDKDNIAFAKKFILDGLQKAGIIPNDGWDNIVGWKEKFYVDKTNPRTEVLIQDYERKVRDM